MTFVIFNKQRKKYFSGVEQKNYPTYHIATKYKVKLEDAFKYNSIDHVNFAVNWVQSDVIYCIDTDRWFDESEWNRFYKIQQL